MKTRAGRSRSFVFVITACLIMSSGVSAQETAVGQAIGNVLAALQVVALQDLDFGDILQGVGKTVPTTDDANSGIFEISGEPTNNREVSMHMMLPEYLWNNNPGGQDRMVIYFQDTHATIDTTAGTPSAPGLGALIGINPHMLPDTGIGGTAGVIRIYLGGTVYPVVHQRAGVYTADITLTASYTGD